MMGQTTSILRRPKGIAIKGRAFLISLALLLGACGGGTTNAPTATPPSPKETAIPTIPEATTAPAPPTPSSGAKEREMIPCTENDQKALICITTGEQVSTVIVVIPKQKDETLKTLEVWKVPWTNDEPPPEQASFSLIKKVINFEVVISGTKPLTETVLSKFDPALQIQVPFTEDDVKQAGGPAQFELAFFDHDKKIWVDFAGSDNNRTIKFMPNGSPQDKFVCSNPELNTPPEKGGFACITISNWADRHTAMGKR